MKALERRMETPCPRVDVKRNKDKESAWNDSQGTQRTEFQSTVHPNAGDDHIIIRGPPLGALVLHHPVSPPPPPNRVTRLAWGNGEIQRLSCWIVELRSGILGLRGNRFPSSLRSSSYLDSRGKNIHRPLQADEQHILARSSSKHI